MRPTVLRRSVFKRCPVTIIVGIICKDGIVVASDSQTSWGHSSKKTNVEKIHSVKFSNAIGIIAGSGSIYTSGDVIESVVRACVGAELTDHRQLAECAQAATEKLRSNLMKPYQGFGANPADFEPLFEQYNFSILTANYFKDKPYLYSLDFPPGIPSRATKVTAIGCGATLAEFLLSWFDFSEMSRPQAALTATFIIGEVKKADSFCGGPTQIAFIEPPPKMSVKRFDSKTMEVIESELESESKNFKSGWGESVSKVAKRIVKRIEKSDSA